MRKFASCAAALIFTVCCTLAHAADKPNVIFILSDDLGYGDLGCYGQEKIKTPNIDRLAAEGMRFTQHYAGSPVCGPSRSCLLTGQHAGRTPIRANPSQTLGWDLPAQGDPPLPGDALNFAKLFKQSGYDTACIGKWGFGAPNTAGDPRKHGFDYFFGYANHRDAHKYYPAYLWRNGEKVELDGKQYSHDLITREALDYVGGREPDKPFLLYLTWTIPHGPLNPPDVSPYAQESWPEVEKKYAAMITRMDSDVGKLLALLQERKVDCNTLVIFTSDNGADRVGKHRVDFFRSNGPLRGRKTQVFEGGIRVPFIARWPGKIKGGASSDHVSAFWDWLPTAAELLSLPPLPAGDIDGISMLPALLGRDAEQKRHRHLYWELRRKDGGGQAVRVGDFKGVRLNLATHPDPPLALYNLENDIAEQHDVAAQHPEMVRQMEQIIAAAHVPSRRFPLTQQELQELPDAADAGDPTGLAGAGALAR